MSFTAFLRQAADTLWEESFRHPFVTELAAGTLPVEKFAHYVQNDAYYLQVFAQVQAMAAAKSGDLASLGRLAAHAQATVEAELALHQTFFGMLGIERDPLFLPAPTNHRYTTHLLTVAHLGTVGEIIAAILPCYWLYWEIGQRYKDSRPNHPIYDKWIQTYGDEWFGTLVNEQIERLNALAEAAPEAERFRMRRHFLISSTYELEFWNMAYTLERWPFEESR
ncbi:MAG: thiaminase II [Alicyclobacillus macrosporangiidus]|uniref:thiaminase II n=1 Tax=Alicyclobacillus macrosporangiidus TaxID=392015 RepID=UPI0026EF815B|nr:thiaminase II [Alicyclobacillus macrosporangiidus]MCL6600807.1 thiaminase II [Alicyclobacillus macrosporangiidus]